MLFFLIAKRAKHQPCNHISQCTIDTRSEFIFLHQSFGSERMTLWNKKTRRSIKLLVTHHISNCQYKINHATIWSHATDPVVSQMNDNNTHVATKKNPTAIVKQEHNKKKDWERGEKGRKRRRYSGKEKQPQKLHQRKSLEFLFNIMPIMFQIGINEKRCRVMQHRSIFLLATFQHTRHRFLILTLFYRLPLIKHLLTFGYCNHHFGKSTLVNKDS